MGQEAYAAFPMLARASAEAQLARAQAGNYDIARQQFQQGNQAATAFGNMQLDNSPVPGAQPGPYAPPPQPGQASQPGGSAPMNPYITGPGGTSGTGGVAMGGIRVPPAAAPPAMGGMVATGGPPVGTEDQLTQPGDQAVGGTPAPGAASQPAGASHKWTPKPGETFNTPDGSRPRSLDEVMSALRKANPKADPATLARAAGLYMPWLQEEDQVRLREEMMKNTAAMNNLRVTAAGERQQVAETGKDTRLDTTIAAKQSLQEAAVASREKIAAASNDARYARLAAQKDNWDKKIQIAQGQLELGTNSLAEKGLRDALRAKHDAVYDLTSMMFANRDMTDEEKAAAQQAADQELADGNAAIAQAKAKAVPAARVPAAAPAATPSTGRPVKTQSFRVPGGVAPIGPSPGGFN
jgi:hypothetical protein